MFTLKILAFVAIGILAFLAVAYVVMRLWNWLVPGAFSGPRLQYKYAIGLLLLSRILFGGGFGGGFRGHGWRGNHSDRDGRQHAPWHRGETRPNTPKPTAQSSPFSSIF